MMSYYYDLSTTVDVLTGNAYGSSRDTSFHLAMSYDNVNDLGREMVEQMADYAKSTEEGQTISVAPTGAGETGGTGVTWDVYQALHDEERGNQGGSEDSGGGSSGSGGDYYPSDPTQG